MPIGLSDLKLSYREVAEARQMSGLRIVLGAYPIPGGDRLSALDVCWAGLLWNHRPHAARALSDGRRRVEWLATNLTHDMLTNSRRRAGLRR